jgi:hypothetical protein
MTKAILFKSDDRFESFKKVLSKHNVDFTILDFDVSDWLQYDFSNVDFIIYFPTFKFSSNHPLSLVNVKDSLALLSFRYPHLRIFPDPKILHFYNDKYRQFLFLAQCNYPIPETIPLYTEACVSKAQKCLGFPMVIKNRFGAGGDAVFKVYSLRELKRYFYNSQLNLFNLESLCYYFRMFTKKMFYYFLIKEKKMPYPFLSSPLIAQRLVKTDCDIRVVVNNGKVVEAHWRKTPSKTQWKVNIDGGGIGEWSHIPESVIQISEKLAKELKATWVALDILWGEDGFYITEFSPVWHHYAYKEKPTFVYKDDYNIKLPLEQALDLETLIVESLL